MDGQYEQLEEILARMKIVVSVTLAIIALLLFLQSGASPRLLIILLSIPFALMAASGDVAPRLSPVDGGLGRIIALVGWRRRPGSS